MVPGRVRSWRDSGRTLERLDGTGLPEVAGTGATVVVTMTLETLMGGLAAATLDTGDRITAHTARRLACEAGIIPSARRSARDTPEGACETSRTRGRSVRSCRVKCASRAAGPGC